MSQHDDGMDPELTSSERELFAALPREREPGRLLEERTVRALRERGLIQAPAQSQPVRRIPMAWMSGAVAAGIALFLGGLATGQYLGARNTEVIVGRVQQRDAQTAALMVQQTGTAYVQALSRLSQVSDTTRGGGQGREVARQMLRQAADEMVRMNPNDPVASGILAAFDRGAQQRRPVTSDTTGQQRMVWF